MFHSEYEESSVHKAIMSPWKNTAFTEDQNNSSFLLSLFANFPNPFMPDLGLESMDLTLKIQPPINVKSQWVVLTFPPTYQYCCFVYFLFFPWG